ncbi:MAG TPA: hypothetical protein VN906_09105 [Candidatus Sulfotelmatobacter sp.]|nr:hypothetical protein [Candidatus Sulfotelmatobacter sp.]
MGRFDTILADTRKYGFTLVTLLLTANALITTTNPVADRVAASSVIIVLLLVLFLMDRYWWVMLIEAAARARELEPGLGIEITVQVAKGAHRTRNTLAATVVYGIFVAVAGLVALVTVWPSGSDAGRGIVIGATVVALVAITLLHRWFRDRLMEIELPSGVAA